MTQTEDQEVETYQYPAFRALHPDLTDEEFDGMMHVVCGWAFGNLEVPEA
jgi:hypothetical protein